MYLFIIWFNFLDNDGFVISTINKQNEPSAAESVFTNLEPVPTSTYDDNYENLSCNLDSTPITVYPASTSKSNLDIQVIYKKLKTITNTTFLWFLN